MNSHEALKKLAESARSEAAKRSKDLDSNLEKVWKRIKALKLDIEEDTTNENVKLLEESLLYIEKCVELNWYQDFNKWDTRKEELEKEVVFNNLD